MNTQIMRIFYQKRRSTGFCFNFAILLQQGFTEIAGQVVSMIFHAWAVVVMLNMLVAMLSHSFDRVRNNAELEWKFHRTRTWMKFIRKGVYPRPPPMNLVPSTRDFKSFWNFLKVVKIITYYDELSKSCFAKQKTD